MRNLLYRTMNFAYLEKGVPRVVTARVMLHFPPDLKGRVQHILSNIAAQRSNLFVINDEEMEHVSGNLETDHIQWKLDQRAVTAIPRADKDPKNRSCICCAMAEYFSRCMVTWLRGRPELAELITLDIVVADHEDSQFIDDVQADLQAMFFEASVYVMEIGTRSWSKFGVFFTDQRKYDGATIFLQEKGYKGISVSNCNAVVVDYSGDSVHDALSAFTDRFGVYDGVLTIKD